MNFHLQFSIPSFTHKIKYTDQLLFAGSCFAENIGETMQHYKFNTLINPHGVLYNPKSIAVALRRYIDNKLLEESELFFANECWNSWEHHSRFSNPDKQKCLTGINEAIVKGQTQIKNGDWLFITFGSAFVYKHTRSNQLVGNCHKISQQEFTKELLSSSQIIEEFNILIRELKKINSKLKIVFTISPVRYIRDGVVENNLSKARLIDAVHQLVAQNNNTFYFPAYELIIDDLRDYRFYKKDLVHPNEQAIDYVFEQWMNVAFDKNIFELFERIKDILVAKEHRPFNSDITSYQKFKATYLERCKQIQQQNSFMDLNDEIRFFSPLA